MKNIKGDFNMKSKNKQNFLITGLMFAVFAVFTLTVKLIDVQPIGPNGSSVGFASVNSKLFQALGQSGLWDKLTDVFLLAALLSAVCFAVLGLYQLIKRKSFAKVDRSIYVLAGLYVSAAVMYVLFEVVDVNFRPVLVDGALEASYPSTHTMIVCALLTSAVLQIKERVESKGICTAVTVISILLIVLTAVGRLLSGMHWLTDVLGGLLLGEALVMLYKSVAGAVEK